MSTLQKPTKPLSCYYCEHAHINPGYHGSYLEPPEPASADCDCLDVSLDLFAIWERLNLKPYVSPESWLPYHCGHFLPRMIRVKCAHKRCIKVIDTSEWLAAKNMYIGPYDELCCSQLCADILNKEMLLDMERNK